MTGATLSEDRVAPTTDDVAGLEAMPWSTRASTWVSDNRLFCGAFAVAALVRLLVAIAYAPALEFFADSYAYLAGAHQPFRADIWHPLGYPVLVWLTSATRNIAVLTLLQHVLGLATGVLIYRLVRGVGVGAVGASLAATPVLFDAYQIDVEQFVLSETLFTFLVVAAISAAVRLVRTRAAGTAIGAGSLLAAASLTRTVGLAVAVVVVIVLLLSRVGWTRAAAVAATTAVPIGAYALAFHASFGVYALQGFGGRYLYGIVAPFASCHPDRLPPEQRSLCPTLPTYARPGSNQYVWNEYAAAQLPGDDIERSQIAGSFARRVVMQQPGRVVRATAGNLLHYFEPGRTAGPRDWYVGSWQFPTDNTAPAWNIQPATAGFRSNDGVHGHVVVGIAKLLRGYQRVVFTPGPLLLAALVCAAIACVVERRNAAARMLTALLACTGLSLLALPAVSAGFDWRYLLPAQAVLVPAGVVAAWLLQPAVRRWLRRATPIVVAAAVAALTAPGLADSSVYADAVLRPAESAGVPATLSIGGHASVHVGPATLIGVACWRTEEGQRRLQGLVAFPTAVTYTSGRPLLVQMSNFGLSNGRLTVPGTRPKGDVLRGVVLSRRYPSAHGAVYADVRSQRGVLRYVDPYGGGAAAWTFHLPATPAQAPLGSRCTGASPWAGMRLHSLRIFGVDPFTVLGDQSFTYGVMAQPWRVDSYDVRFRVSSPTAQPGPWQYPRTWQRTTATQQSLINLSSGITYCFSVRARDSLGAVTDWSLPRCTARLYDDAAFAPAAGWTRATGQAGFYGGTYTATTTKNATLSVSGTFSRVALSLYRCPACGVVDVFLGSQLVRRLDLASAPAAAGLMRWTSPVLPDQPNQLTLRVHSSGRLVAVDGFGLMR